VTVSSAAVSGSGFTISGASFPLTLNPNQSATLTVQFDPTTAGAVTGTLTLASNSSAGSTTVVSLSGTGTAEPVLSGLTCTNASMTSAGTDSCTVTLNSPAQSGGFLVMLSSNNSAVTVPSTVTVVSGAKSVGFSATVTAVSSAQTVTLTAWENGVSLTFALQLGAATQTQALSVNATTIAFGNVSLNSPATQSVTLTSTGTGAVTVNSATITGTGFSISGETFPLTLNSNQTATLSVQFDPTAAGSASGNLTIASNSSTNPSVAIALTGTGVAAAYQVDLSWNAPSGSSDPVAGYNVYRAPSGSTSYQQVNTSAVTQTAYVDGTVQTGQTYNYIVESVDASGDTSAPSNMASVVVP
jgi:hypothetical protein